MRRAVTIVGISAARRKLGQLVTAAAAGSDIVITRRGKPVARIVPVQAAPATTGKRRPGRLAGVLTLDPGFFDPLPEDELARWE